MNRSEHLQATIFKNIEDTIDYENIEFILLDYNSSDNLEGWVKNNLNSYIEKGILKYYRTTEPESFHRSHSRNIALKLAEGTIVCNLDADNFLGKDFAYFINYHFSYHSSIFLTSGVRDGSYGRICVKKEDFLKVRGYDEKMSGWGYEDDDFYDRLTKTGLSRIEFFDTSFTNIIDHEIEESILNDKEVSIVKDIYVNQITYKKSVLIYVMTDDTFKYGIVTRLSDYSEIELEDSWQSGTTLESDTSLVLEFNKKRKIQFSKTAEGILKLESNSLFKPVKNKLLRNSVLRMLTSLENKNRYTEKSKETIVSNNEFWGNANLKKNFLTEFSI
jgi:hypothetical protein